MALTRRKKETPESLQGVTEQDLVNQGLAEPAPKKKLSPALAAGLVGLPLLALGAWYFLGAQSVDSVDESTTIASSVATPPSPDDSPAAATSPVPAGRVSVPARVPPGANARLVKPGQAGIKPSTVPTGVPVIAPERPGSPPRLAPARGVPTPIRQAPGLGAIPGRTGKRGEVVVSPPSEFIPAAQLAQLKALWKQGARAKQRNDYAGARRAWQQMLRVRPGHPGVQEAIDKLPRR